DGERLVADHRLGAQHRVPQPQRLGLTDVDAVDSAGCGRLNGFQQRRLVSQRQFGFELVGFVEMILDGSLVASGDEDHVGNSRCRRLLDRILDQRLVDDRQHLFRACLGHGQESRAESGYRKHGLGYFSERHLSLSFGQCLELPLVEHRYVELDGAIQLAARVGSRDDITGLFRYAAGHLAALRFDQLLGFIARQGRQRSGEDEYQTGELARRCALRRTFRPMYPGGAQLGNDFAVVRFGEELTNALCQHRPDIMHFEQRRLVGIFQRVEIAEMPRQVLGGCFADVADTQRINEAGQCRAAALVDRRNDVGRGFFRHALELGQRRDTELVDIRRRANNGGVDQLIDQLVAETLDVHRSSAGKVQQRALALRRTDEAARAARDRLVGQPHDRGAAFGTLGGHHELPRPGRTLVGQYAGDFRNDVAGTAHNDGVADADVLAPDLVLVMQRSVGYRDAADEYGLQ